MQNYRNVFQTSILSKYSFFQQFVVSPFQSSPFCLLPCFLHFPNDFKPSYASVNVVSIMHQECKLMLQEGEGVLEGQCLKGKDSGVIVSYLVIAFMCNSLLFGGSMEKC